MAAVGGQRDPDALRPGKPDADGVGLKGPPGVDHFVLLAVLILAGKRGQNLVQRPKAPGAGDDIVSGNIQEAGQSVP
ncbi:hypothetical protein D3C85_1706960 [compost metagenome]